MSTLNNYQKSSVKLSEINRYVVYGILGIAFAILTLRIEYFNDKISDLRTLLLITIILSILSLLFDYFNILFQYLNSRYKYVNNIDEDDMGKKWFYKLGFFCFYAKQILMVLAVIILIISLERYL